MPAATAVTTDNCALADLPVPALVVDARGDIAFANAACVLLFGDAIAGSAFASRLGHGVPPPDPGNSRAVWRAEGCTGAGVPFVVDASATRRADGSAVVVLREVTGALLVGESVRHLDAAFASAPIGMAFFDTEGRYVRVNHALCELLGRTPEELIGRRDSDLTHPDDRQSDVDAAWRILRGEVDTWQTEKRFVRPCGSVVWAIANMSFLRDDERRPLCWLGQFQDITARKQLEDRLRGEAGEDPLTGVANRRRLHADLRAAIAGAARQGHGGALIYIDLDGFKAINDTYGHDTGDRLLREVAAAMVGRCRATDTVARIGGDEFAVLVPVATPAQARAVRLGLQRVLDAVTTGHRASDTDVPVTATLGLAWFGPDNRLSPDDIIAEADHAMYAARLAPARAGTLARCPRPSS